MQVSSPGRATPAPKYKKTKKGGRFAFKNFFFPPFKSHTHGIYEFAALGSLLFAFFDSVLRFYSSPTSKYSTLKLSSFSLVYFWSPFGALNCGDVLKYVEQFWFVFLLGWVELGVCMRWPYPYNVFWSDGECHIVLVLLLLMPKRAPTKCSVKCLNGISAWFS